MSVQDYLLILGGVGTLVTIIGGQIILIIQAIKANQKIDAAAQRREEIASTVLDPSTAIQTAPPAPPKV